MFDLEDDLREVWEGWFQEERVMAREQNPLKGYVQRVLFVRRSCRHRKNHRKAGKRRWYSKHEVELMKILPGGQCVQVKDLRTPLLDSLAEEVFAGLYIPPDVNKGDLFLEYFRKL